MDKSPDAFRTISEVADVLETPAHVLRFWESRFPQLRPVKRAGGRRYYRPSDVALLAGIKRLLHDEGLTIRGVQKILRDQGVRHVAGLSDESVSVADLVHADSAGVVQLEAWRDVPDVMDDVAETEEDAAFPPEEVPEAAFIAVEDDDDLPGSALAKPAQAVLPLFDLPPQPKAPPRQSTLRDDASFPSLIRALQPKSLALVAPQIADLARRLTSLRDQLASRAGGNPG